MLELTYLLPLLGWFVILPASMIIGSGAANLGLLSKLKLALFATSPVRPVMTESDEAVAGRVGH